MKHVLINISGMASPIFKFKVSMYSSHQARLNGVILLKINAAVLEILNFKPFRTKHVLINISGTASPIFKFKVSMDSSHQVQFIGVGLLKISAAVHEIFMKNPFRMKHVLINISRMAPPILKFKVSLALSHQA